MAAFGIKKVDPLKMVKNLLLHLSLKTRTRLGSIGMYKLTKMNQILATKRPNKSAPTPSFEIKLVMLISFRLKLTFQLLIYIEVSS